MSQRLLARMSALTRTVAFIWFVLVFFWAAAPATVAGQAPVAKDAKTNELFGATKLWALHLEISAKEYEAMQPPAAAFGPPGAPPPAPKDPKDKRESERNLFGTEFPWVQADLTAEGKTYKKVGLRYSGEITYFASALGLKRPLKIEFNKFADQRFQDLTSLQLHAMPMDPSKGREVLAYSLFRAAGVPAPRTAYAEVTLTVPGKYDKEYLGLYTVVENVDKTFLADRFGARQRRVDEAVPGSQRRTVRQQLEWLPRALSTAF